MWNTDPLDSSLCPFSNNLRLSFSSCYHWCRQVATVFGVLWYEYFGKFLSHWFSFLKKKVESKEVCTVIVSKCLEDAIMKAVRKDGCWVWFPFLINEKLIDPFSLPLVLLEINNKLNPFKVLYLPPSVQRSHPGRSYFASLVYSTTQNLILTQHFETTYPIVVDIHIENFLSYSR